MSQSAIASAAVQDQRQPVLALIASGRRLAAAQQ